MPASEAPILWTRSPPATRTCSSTTSPPAAPPFGGRWLGLILPAPVRIIREDRILHEIHATGGDVRRVCDLFGLTVAGAIRYAATLDPPGLEPGQTRRQH